MIHIPQKPPTRNQLMAFVYCRHQPNIDLSRILHELQDTWQLETHDEQAYFMDFVKSQQLQQQYGGVEKMEEMLENGTLDRSVLDSVTDFEDESKYNIANFDIGEEDYITLTLMPFETNYQEVNKIAHNRLDWDEMESDFEEHEGYIMVSLLSDYEIGVQQYVTFAKLVAAVLEGTNSSGVYLPAQHLYTSKRFFLFNVGVFHRTDQDDYPISLFVAIATAQKNGKEGFYTQGLDFMGRMEMEVIETNSAKAANDVLWVLIAHLISKNLVFTSSTDVFELMGHRVKLDVSPAFFLEGIGDTVKVSVWAQTA